MPELYTNSLRDHPSSVRSYGHISTFFEMKNLEAVASEHHIQIGDYVFGLLCEAWLEVMDLDEMVVYYIFGGRNSAEFQSSAGFFPYRIMIPVRRDERFFEHVGGDVLSAIENSAPHYDVSYRIFCKNEYPYPYLSYNCLEMIGENEDFMFSAVSGEAAAVEKSARKAIPHMDCSFYVAKDAYAVIQVNYDPEFISEEKIRDVLDRAVELSEEINRYEK